MKYIRILIVTILLCTLMSACNHSGDMYISTDPGYLDYVKFDSYEGIQKFVSFINSEPDDGSVRAYMYDSSQSEYNFCDRVFYTEAKEMVSNLTGTMIPKVKDGVSIDEFGASYSVSGTVPFSIGYRVNGIMYRFRYCFNCTESTKLENSLRFPTIGNVTMGSVVFELYQTETSLNGSFTIGTTEVLVLVFADCIDDVDFSQFELVDISQ